MPVFLQHQAEGNLRYIRQTMERATTLSSVSGLGGVVMGCVALLAGGFAHWQVAPGDTSSQLRIWLVAAVVAFLVGVVSMLWKARSLGQTLFNDAGRRFLTCLVPSLAVGAMLTAALWSRQQWSVIPPIWMLCYGTGILSAGTYAARPLPWMGAAFLALGTVALAEPDWNQILLTATFGLLHVAFGIVLMRRFGG